MEKNPRTFILDNRKLHGTSHFSLTDIWKYLHRMFFGLPPTALLLQQLSRVGALLHYGNEVNSKADIYGVSCHASWVTAAVHFLITESCVPQDRNSQKLWITLMRRKFWERQVKWQTTSCSESINSQSRVLPSWLFCREEILTNYGDARETVCVGGWMRGRRFFTVSRSRRVIKVDTPYTLHS